MTGEIDERDAARRVLMDRARADAERDKVRPPRRVVPRVIAGVLALAVVLVVMLGFDAFLTSVQKVLEIPATEPVPDPSAPIPAFVVDEEPPAGDEPAGDAE